MRSLSRPRPTPRTGGLPAWVPLLLLGCLVALGFAALRDSVDRSGFNRVATSRSTLDGQPFWADPRWELELAEQVAALEPFDPDSAAAQRELLDSIAGLSFVARVGEARIVWPDGVEVFAELRRPLACIRVDDVYLSLSEDGMVLSGAWTAPPFADSAYLPVIGPNDGSFDGWRPGMQLVEQRHLDGLAIAVSMWSELDIAARRPLGRMLIDASASGDTTDGGARLRLEGGRDILWGRSPNIDAPGELPSALKWRFVARGLEQLSSGRADDDWVVLDVRFDEPTILLEHVEGSDGAPRETADTR